MTVYTTLAPCPQCWGRMMVAGIKEIIYGVPDLPSTQDFEKSVPEMFMQTKPKIRHINNEQTEICNNVFLETREEIDKKFFR